MLNKSAGTSNRVLAHVLEFRLNSPIITGRLQLPQLSPRYLSRSCCHDSPGTCGLLTANLVSSKHMGLKWPYLHSVKQWIFTVIRTHLYACAFLMQKKAFNRVNHWTQANRQKCAIAYCEILLSFGIESKSSSYDGVTHYQ